MVEQRVVSDQRGGLRMLPVNARCGWCFMELGYEEERIVWSRDRPYCSESCVERDHSVPYYRRVRERPGQLSLALGVGESSEEDLAVSRPE